MLQEVFQEVVVAQEQRLTLELPAGLVGKRLRVLAFEESGGPQAGASAATVASALTPEELERRTARLRAHAANLSIDFSTFTFNRDEANNYDE